MFRTLSAAFLSAALALPATTAPARAELDGRDLARILGGIATVYILKEAIEDRRERRDRRAAPVTRHAPRHSDRPVRRHYTHSHGRFGAHTHRLGIDHARAHPRRHDGHRDRRRQEVRLIPQQCRRVLTTRTGPARGFGARCMQNAVARPGILPPDCLRRVETFHGTRYLYGGRCLRRNGWSHQTARN